MISVDIEGHRFQFRAAAVVVHEGFVLLHRWESDGFWALPGGRVEPGEASSSTIRREMAEELHESVECGELLFAVENFFVHASKVDLRPSSLRESLSRPVLSFEHVVHHG